MAKKEFIQFDIKNRRVLCQGEWILTNLESIKNELVEITWPISGEIIFDDKTLTKMDSAGAWLFCSIFQKLEKKDLKVSLEHFSEHHRKLLTLIQTKLPSSPKAIPHSEKLNQLAIIGKDTIRILAEIRDFLAFTGQITMAGLRVLFQPKHWRWRTFASVIEVSGYQALGIIAVLSFMIGLVIAYQTGLKLQDYGANIFIVDLIGYAILREFGPLITAILLAGRTGSAFTAQLGTMKINQEIDALNTMGVTPAELLILPRLAGLVVVLPLLTVWADIFGVLGGMIMSKNILNITWYEFLQRFHQQVPLRAFIIGLGKAPVFALLIAAIGCFQGIKVERNADSVGKHTTRSVVLAIFFIIIVDALFSIIFSTLKL